jgi:hypothetical protein
MPGAARRAVAAPEHGLLTPVAVIGREQDDHAPPLAWSNGRVTRNFDEGAFTYYGP